MIAKLLLQNTIFVVALGALLFASAGTLDWPAAWVFLVVSATLGPACGLWLAKTDPALLAERMRPTFQADQPAADKKFMLTFVVVVLLWLIAIGLDHFRYVVFKDATWEYSAISFPKDADVAPSHIRIRGDGGLRSRLFPRPHG